MDDDIEQRDEEHVDDEWTGEQTKDETEDQAIDQTRDRTRDQHREDRGQETIGPAEEQGRHPTSEQRTEGRVPAGRDNNDPERGDLMRPSETEGDGSTQLKGDPDKIGDGKMVEDTSSPTQLEDGPNNHGDVDRVPGDGGADGAADDEDRRPVENPPHDNLDEDGEDGDDRPARHQQRS